MKMINRNTKSHYFQSWSFTMPIKAITFLSLTAVVIFHFVPFHHESTIITNHPLNAVRNLLGSHPTHSITSFYDHDDNTIHKNEIGKPDNSLQSGINTDNKSSSSLNANRNHENEPMKLLHIVTALTDRKGSFDRLTSVFIPILKESVNSMISSPYNYQVDVYLILGWKLIPERRKLIQDALPPGVGLQIWDDAVPIGYDGGHKNVSEITRSLARQHRFVIKDKLEYYDFFSVFEDDMLVTGAHVSHFLDMLQQLQQLEQQADDVQIKKETDSSFHGPLSKEKIRRFVPGFIRVEVLKDDVAYPDHADTRDPIIPDFNFIYTDKMTQNEVDQTINKPVDSSLCCKLPSQHTTLPDSDDVVIWETAVKGAVVRKMPSGASPMLEWVLMQPGPKIPPHASNYIGGYWSGRDGAYGKQNRPGAGEPTLFAQQGGWMATKELLIDMHLNHCVGGYFPPFDQPSYNQDGLTLNNVEFWSGGFQFFGGGKGGCNMQRVISLHPEHLSKHLLYHTANNKQEQYNTQTRILRANTFFGQVNAVRKAARKALQVEQSL